MSNPAALAGASRLLNRFDLSAIQWWKVRHFFRDLFMPRYALIVELVSMPDPSNPFSGRLIPAPVVRRLPYKRPFFMPFNQFYNELTDSAGFQAMIFCGSKRTLLNLYGIGSARPHNVKNAILFKGKASADDPASLVRVAFGALGSLSVGAALGSAIGYGVVIAGRFMLEHIRI